VLRIPLVGDAGTNEIALLPAPEVEVHAHLGARGLYEA
jgi:hypothetical protein